MNDGDEWQPNRREPRLTTGLNGPLAIDGISISQIWSETFKAVSEQFQSRFFFHPLDYLK